MSVEEIIKAAQDRCPELRSSGATGLRRRAVEPVLTFLYLPDVGDNFTTKDGVNLMLALCPSGWWIVGRNDDDDKHWEDRGPFDAFEAAYATLKMLAT